jgi:hypothetical protein
MWFKEGLIIFGVVFIGSDVLVSGIDIISGHFQRGWDGQDVLSIAGVSVAMTIQNITNKTCLINCIREPICLNTQVVQLPAIISY